MTTKDIDKEKLERLISECDINPDNIYHIILSGDIELIGELFPPEQIEITNNDEDDLEELFDDEDEIILELDDDLKKDFENDLTRDDPDDLIFLNPIRIVRDRWVDENGNFEHKHYFIEWNPCIEGPYTHINKNKILAINTPNAETLVEYLKAIYNQYYPLLDELQKSGGNITGSKINLENLKITTPQTINVINFFAYKSKRDSGTF